MNGITTKHCNGCANTLPLNDFPYKKRNGKLGYYYRCKQCCRVASRKERAKLLSNPQRKANLLYLNAKSSAKHYHKNYNKFKVKLANDCELRKRAYDTKQKWKINKMKNPEFRLKTKLCSRLRTVIKSGKSWDSHLDCDLTFLQRWFEYHFRLLKVFDGIELSWDKNTEWEIDHIIPCKAFDFTNSDHLKICFHWSNLAPLTKSHNSSKRAKIIPQLIRRQLLLSNLFIHLTGNSHKTVKIADICDYTGALTTAVDGKLLVPQVE